MIVLAHVLTLSSPPAVKAFVALFLESNAKIHVETNVMFSKAEKKLQNQLKITTSKTFLFLIHKRDKVVHWSKLGKVCKLFFSYSLRFLRLNLVGIEKFGTIFGKLCKRRMFASVKVITNIWNYTSF